MKFKTLFAILLATVMILILAGCGTGATVTVTTAGPTETVTSTQTMTAIAQTVTVTSPATTVTITKLPASFIPITFTGSGDMTTPPFAVTTSEWIIDWSYTTDSNYPGLYIYIYPRGETASFVTNINSGDISSGSSYCYAGAGEYYLKVSEANLQNWTITIRPPS
jgi:uncharacterized protein YceK